MKDVAPHARETTAVHKLDPEQGLDHLAGGFCARVEGCVRTSTLQSNVEHF